jgi:hypothetical protein
MDLAKIDFQQLRVNHIFFKTKVRALLYGAPYDEAYFTEGPVSVWFDTVGRTKYPREPEITELASLHQRLNTAAVGLFRQYRAGMIDQAHEDFKNIDRQSDQFLALVARIEQRMSAN